MKIRINTRLTPQQKAQWKSLIAEEPTGDIAIDLFESLKAAAFSNLEFYYLEVLSEQDGPRDSGAPSLLALAVIHVIDRMDLAPYIGGIVQKIFLGIGKLGFHPLSMKVAFLELPFCNSPGLFLTSEGQPYESEIVKEVVHFVRKEIRCDLFNVKMETGSVAQKALQELGMLHSPFLANMRLNTSFSSFENYFRSLPKAWRQNLRANQRKFEAFGGEIEVTTNLTPHIPTLTKLFELTDSHHVSQGHLGRPLKINEALLEALSRESINQNLVLFIAKLKNQVVGAVLAFRSGKDLIATKCGLIYSLAKPSAAYFNIYYAFIQYAIANELKSIELGAEAYDIKRRMGAASYSISYSFDLNFKWIMPLIKFLVRRVSKQKGARLHPI